jgi:hypothetical protein
MDRQKAPKIGAGTEEERRLRELFQMEWWAGLRLYATRGAHRAGWQVALDSAPAARLGSGVSFACDIRRCLHQYGVGNQVRILEDVRQAPLGPYCAY